MEKSIPEWLRRVFPWLFMAALSVTLLDQAFNLLPIDSRWPAMVLALILGVLMLLLPASTAKAAAPSGLDTAGMTMIWLVASSIVARRSLVYDIFGWVAAGLFAVLLWGLLQNLRGDDRDIPSGSPWLAAGVGILLLGFLITLVGGPASVLPVILGGGFLFLAAGFAWSFVIYPRGELEWPMRLGLGFTLGLGVQPVAFIYLNRLGMPITRSSVIAVVAVLCLLALAVLTWQRRRLSDRSS